MDYQEMVDQRKKIIEREEFAWQVMKTIMGQEKMQILISDMGEHLGMWVIWEGKNGANYARQFSWSRENPGREGIRFQWIYDAFDDARKMREADKNTDWTEEVRKWEEKLFNKQ